MDITCPTCDEPIEDYSLYHEVIWETSLTKAQKEAFKGTLEPPYKAALEADGWQFPPGATSINTFIRCPCCPKGLETNQDALLKNTILSDLLAGDIDGITAMRNDLQI